MPETTHWTVEAYLAFEQTAETRHEYYNGEVYERMESSRNHNLINGNIHAKLHAQLEERPCEIYANEMRVRVNPIQYVYPDISIVCGEPQFGDEKPDTLLNPTVIIEVLSPSADGYDRTTKSKHYRELASLQEYLLISQERVHLEHYVRQRSGQWLLTDVREPGGVLQLESVQCTLAAADVYKKVEFAESSPEANKNDGE